MPRPQQPSAPRLFYHIHCNNFIIDYFVRTKAEFNTALRVESNPAEYLKIQNYIEGSERRILEVSYPMLSTCIICLLDTSRFLNLVEGG
jgi:hypothetical protein